jgi:hypothetical protein
MGGRGRRIRAERVFTASFSDWFLNANQSWMSGRRARPRQEQMYTDSIMRELPIVIAAPNKLVPLCLTFLIFGALPCFIQGQEIVSSFPTCDQASGASASISSVGSAAPLTFRPVPQDGRIEAVGHVYVRNDAGFPLSQWCARGYFLDYLDRPQKVRLTLNGVQQSSDNACVALSVNAGLIQDFKLSIEADRDSLPISGLVTIQGSGNTEKRRGVEVEKLHAARVRAPGALTNQRPERCTAVSKEVWQSVVVPSTQSASHGGELLLLTGLIGGLFFVACLARFRDKLMAPMGASQWSFSSSAATNLTFVGSLLGMVLVSSSVPDFPRQMSKQSFIVLGLLFSVLAGLAPLLYNFCCKPVGQNSTNPQLVDFEGWVWLFLLADGLTIWAVCGQLGTLGLLFNEFSMRQVISNVSAVCAWCVAVGVGLALLIYCFRTARFYVEEYPTPTAAAAAHATRIPAPRWTAL